MMIIIVTLFVILLFRRQLRVLVLLVWLVLATWIWTISYGFYRWERTGPLSPAIEMLQTATNPALGRVLKLAPPGGQ